jgi:hypothetical protein
MKIAVWIEHVFVPSLTQLRVGHTNSCSNVTKLTDEPATLKCKTLKKVTKLCKIETTNYKKPLTKPAGAEGKAYHII